MMRAYAVVCAAGWWYGVSLFKRTSSLGVWAARVDSSKAGCSSLGEGRVCETRVEQCVCATFESNSQFARWSSCRWMTAKRSSSSKRSQNPGWEVRL
jgi:hypothetical protein